MIEPVSAPLAAVTLVVVVTPEAAPPILFMEMSLPVMVKLAKAVVAPVAPVIVTSPLVPPVRVTAPAPFKVWLNVMLAPAAVPPALVVSTVMANPLLFTKPVKATASPEVRIVVAPPPFKRIVLAAKAFKVNALVS